MKKDFDAIIVGGGPGGLAIGSLLSREGISSAIIEKDSALGGRYRSVDFHGCRVDSATHFLVSLAGAIEKTSIYQLFSTLGLSFDYKEVPWAMGLVTQEKPGQVDYFTMDPALGAANFFEFFAFATGAQMDDSAKDEMMRIANICADMSEEECRRAASISFAEWIDKNVQNPVTAAVLYGMEPIVGAPAHQLNFGYVAKAFGTFISAGAPLIWYPENGSLENTFISPLQKYYIDHGGTVITDRTVRNIIIENGRATGVAVADHSNRFMMEEYHAPVVICAMPIFEAVAKNVLRSEYITEEWADTIRKCAELAGPDLSGFFLLREEVIPRDNYGWIHIFDTDPGLPTYIGDCSLGAYVGGTEPPGKQLVTSLVIGTSPSAQFGLNPNWDTIIAGHERWKASIEKAFPGFNKAIEYEGFNLQLNFTRYAYAVVSTETDIQSPNIEGLYFAGDSIRAVGNPMSDKCYEIAFPLAERITQYLRSGPASAPTDTWGSVKELEVTGSQDALKPEKESRM